jgi:hypothetical protein
MTISPPYFVVVNNGTQIFQYSRSYLTILGDIRVTKQVPTDPQILGSIEQNLIAMATLRPGFVHTLSYVILGVNYIQMLSDVQLVRLPRYCLLY